VPQLPTLLESLSTVEGVRAAALFGADKRVVECGFGERVLALAEAAATARHIFKETHPIVRLLSLEYQTARILLMSIDGGVLVIEAQERANIRLILRSVEDFTTVVQSSEKAPESDVPCAPLEAMNLISRASRVHLGGPVIRNYMKKAQTELLAKHSHLRHFTVGLDGSIAKIDETSNGDNVGPALGAWARAFLVRVAIVVPELAGTDLRHLTQPILRQLEPTGFFINDEHGGSSNV
jgi:predicted regulator of Ras-like GTPase activity (Roadblock/LC7/MglB family)